jgi:hypothetical protein
MLSATMKQAIKNRIELRRKEAGRLWSQPELMDFLSVSGPTFLKIEKDFLERGGRLRKLKFGAMTVRYYDEDVQKLLEDAVAQAIAKPHHMRAKKAAKLAKAAE